MPNSQRSTRLGSLSEFFERSTELFHEFGWVYNFKATEVLMDHVRGRVGEVVRNFFQSLEETDQQFHDILSLKQEGDHFDDWPPQLKRFVASCIHLRKLSEEIKSSPLDSTSSPGICAPTGNNRLPKKWNPKKYSEVIHVGNFVGELCVREECDAVVDIGSGLGYLSNHLASSFKIPVVGVESVPSRVETANKNKSCQSSDSVPQKFVCLRITENISEELGPHLGSYSKVCLTALHACGDLTPWALKYFLREGSCKCVAVVPCCYHKMEVEGPNFPMSKRLNNVLQKYGDPSFLKNTWLWRLACQRAGTKFLDDIGKETKNLFYRALLEKFVHEEKFHLERKTRKMRDSKFETFDEYLENCVGQNGGFNLVDSSGKVLSGEVLASAFSKLCLLHKELIGWSKVITGILALQGALQPIAEDLILLDRLSILLESDAVAECGIVKVIPGEVTPRGMVLFGIKKCIRIGFLLTNSPVAARRSLSSKSRLKKLLAEMPKETIHVPKLKEGRKAKKDTYHRYPAGTINLQVLGNGAVGAPRSLYVFTDQTKYLFNCGEGTQRLAHEHRMKLAKLEHIFVTQNVWDNTGGLPGVALTIQDIGVPEITLHGPPKLEKLFEGTRRFVVLKDLKIKVADMSTEGFADTTMHVDYVTLFPTSQDNNSEKSTSSEESVVFEEDDTDYYAPIKGCKRNLEITTPDGDQNKRTKTDSESESGTSVVAADDDGPSNVVMCFVCRPTKKKGSLMIEKCVEHGVPAGPLLGKLKSGEDVTLPDGRLVKAEEVTSPDCPGPVFIVVDCPDERYIDSMVQNPILNKYHDPSNPDDFPHVVAHFTPSHIMVHPKYKEWMGKFRITTKHLVLNDACKGMGSEAVHRIQHKLGLLDDKMFPPLNEDGVEAFYPVSDDVGSKVDALKKPEIFKDLEVPIIMGSTLLKYCLRPVPQLDTSAQYVINQDENIREVFENEEFSSILEALKSKLKTLEVGTDVFPEFTFLGTGSCIPNKTRNTSGILVQTDPDSYMLMDCGEGTYGQLIRCFGVKQVDEIFSKLKVIYVSHLHADHHIGLIQLIRKRWESLKRQNIPPTPVYLLAPYQIHTWLYQYNKSIERIKNAYQLVPNQDLRFNVDRAQDSVYTAEVKHILGLADVQTTFVRHCPNAFGVAFTHSSGWKITYSGDTMPCENLITIGMDSDVLIHEATMEDDLKKEAVLKMHSTTSEAIEIGHQMSAKFILLTHFSQRYAKVPVINENFGSNVGIAFDNMRVRRCDLPKIPLMYDALKTMFTDDVEEMELKTQKRNKRREFEQMNAKSITQKTYG